MPLLQRVAASGTATLREVYRPNEKALANRERLKQGSALLVAEADGVIAGVVRYRPEPDRLHLFGLAVEASQRRRGVARALIDHVVATARSLGLKTVSLNTVRQTGNVSIFERLGFLAMRERPDELSVSDTFTELTEVYMERAV